MVVRPSRYLRNCYLIVYAVLTLLTLGLTALGGAFALLALTVSVLLVWQLASRLRWQAEQYWRVQCDSEGWWLGRVGAELKPARLVGGTRLWRTLTFLTLLDEQGTHPLLLCPDSAAPDELRRLRVWLISRRGFC
ncbi:protein YgfX [uncultured Gilvimarinus sp.]|jgi:hypothetical protein|uniref:protein YgfX n=1 Tax=uncultured Gilvimarinus sp. TaxID=1689143 RepID=UPI0030DA9002